MEIKQHATKQTIVQERNQRGKRMAWRLKENKNTTASNILDAARVV